MTTRNDKHFIRTSLYNFYNRTTKPVPSFGYINIKKTNNAVITKEVGTTFKK